MNSFLKHHAPSIRFVYSGFDRILLNAIIQPLQRPAIIVGYLDKCRNAPPLEPKYFRQISQDYHDWVKEFAAEEMAKIVEPPKGVRREDWVEPYYRRLGSRQGVAVILKSRENARVAVSYASKTGGHRIEVYSRFVWQYYFYVRDEDFGRIFLRICPYFPFNARVCINGHEYLAERMRRLGISFRKEANAFLTCSDPKRLQKLSDALSGEEINDCMGEWLRRLIPFFTEEDYRRGGCTHRLFLSQVEYATNIIFHRRAALDEMSERLLDLNRTIGKPEKLSVIFGRRVTKRYRGELKTQISDHHLGNPVIRSEFKRSSIKQYVRDHLLLRTETTSNNTRDLGIGKSVKNLGELRETMKGVNDRYVGIQQDVLETYVDRGELRRLREPTVSKSGRRMPGVKLDDPRLLALMGTLIRFPIGVSTQGFRTKDLHEDMARALGKTQETYTLSQLRYDLAKLRVKDLVVKVPGSQRYRLTREGYRICVLFVKLNERIYAPLVAGTLEPFPEDELLPEHRRSTLDQLYSAVSHALDLLSSQVGLKLTG
jgi:hypothetical protein